MQRIDEIGARAERATPGPWFHVHRDDDSCMTQHLVATIPEMDDHQGSGNFVGGSCAEPNIIAGILVQRPLPICNASEKWREDADFIAHAREDIPYLLGVISAVRALHRPYGIYDECDHQHEEAGGDVIDASEIGLTCAKLYDVCRECCTDDGDYQGESCADGHEHGPDKPICKTAELLDALGDD
jgi:hypothetical protein